MTTVAAPPTAERVSRRARMVAPVATITGLAAATVALHVRDPHVSGSWGYCPLSLMGVYCPGCGGLRAVNDLTHGDLPAALSSNLLLVLLMPVAVVLLGRWLIDAWHGGNRVRRVLTAWPLLAMLGAATVVFTVVRNLPGSWLAP
jgi:hypothetical protein